MRFAQQKPLKNWGFAFVQHLKDLHSGTGADTTGLFVGSHSHWHDDVQGAFVGLIADKVVRAAHVEKIEPYLPAD